MDIRSSCIGVGILALLVFGCGDSKSGPTGSSESGASSSDASTGASGATDPTTGAGATTGASATTGSSSSTGGLIGSTSTGAGSTDTTGAGFLVPTDGGPNCLECSTWGECPCPMGEKCAPYSGDGDNAWDSQKCVPVARDPVPVGGICQVEIMIASGLDDCAVGAFCWNIDADTLQGTCVAYCEGNTDMPDCSQVPGTVCVIANDGVLNLCLPSCDPLMPDCVDGDVCVPAPDNEDEFVCVWDASGAEGQAFDPCAYANACDPGLLCLKPEFAAECDPQAPGCCLPFCDLTAPLCPGAGQACAPWYAMGEAPAGHEDLGACKLP